MIFRRNKSGQMAGRNSVLFTLYVFTKISKNCNGYGNIRLNHSIQHIHLKMFQRLIFFTLHIRALVVVSCGGSGVRLNDGPDIKLFILVGLGRSFFVCCLAHRGSTVGFLLLQCSSGVVRHPRDLQVSVATRFCRVLIFASS